MQTKAFFGTEGLTSTSANHIANLAKEANREHQNYLASIQFYSERIGIIGTPERVLAQEGVNLEGLSKVKTAIESIAENNALIAFIREAIKEKERLEKEAKSWKNEVAREALELRRKENISPSQPVHVTEEDMFARLSIGQVEHYLTLEAQCSVIGKYIHEGGALSNARIDAMQKVTHPRTVKENGRDTIVTEYELTVSTDNIDAVYFDFQALHRSYQSELNGMKTGLLIAAVGTMAVADVAHCTAVHPGYGFFAEDYRFARTQYLHVNAELDREEQKIEMDEREKRQELLREVQNLKIVIPNRLKGAYTALMKSGK